MCSDECNVWGVEIVEDISWFMTDVFFFLLFAIQPRVILDGWGRIIESRKKFEALDFQEFLVLHYKKVGLYCHISSSKNPQDFALWGSK